MAKPARPGLVKTRLIARYGAEAAAAVHAAMMHCVMARLRACFEPLLIDVRFVLALAEPYEDRDHPGGGWEIVSQGGGDLGERIGRVWHRIGLGPAIFFGVDSPDVPREHLKGAICRLADAEAIVGPAADGGYWTIGARLPRTSLLKGIDWGGPNVYHQTISRAIETGVNLLSVARWFDVDEPDDLSALRRRIAVSEDQHLVSLRGILNDLVKDGQP